MLIVAKLLHLLGEGLYKVGLVVFFYQCEEHYKKLIYICMGNLFHRGQCPDPYICCKIQNTESPSPTSPLPQENSTIFSLDPNEGVKEMTTNGPSIGDEIIDQKCECVLLNQCDPQNIVNLSATNFSQ